MKDNPLLKLSTFGQSIWLDYIRRQMIDSGELKRLIDEDGLKGVTSNPAIFQKAIAGSTDYDEAIRSLAQAGKSVEAIYQVLTVEDVQRAADLFRPLYDRLAGQDGFVSLEVNPHLAHDTQGTVAEARHLWQALARPNVLIKVPATKEGLPAIRQLITEGINVNVTLLFGLPRYREVAEAYIAGLEDRAAPGPAPEPGGVRGQFLSEPHRRAAGPPAGKTGRGRRAKGPDGEGPDRPGGHRQRQGGLHHLSGNLRERPVSETGGAGGPAPAPPVGQHQHQEPGVPRSQVRGAPHRGRHHQHPAPGDPGGLPGPRRPRRPPDGGGGPGRR